MEKLRIKYGIKVDRMPNGFSLGVFFTVAPTNQFTECYLLMHFGFWYIAIGTTVSCVANYVGTPVMDAIMEAIAKEINYNKAHNLSLDYDLFVLDPNNKDSTPEQIRDCIHDAIKVLDERTK